MQMQTVSSCCSACAVMSPMLQCTLRCWCEHLWMDGIRARWAAATKSVSEDQPKQMCVWIMMNSNSPQMPNSFNNSILNQLDPKNIGEITDISYKT
jgi:hypothetical protein